MNKTTSSFSGAHDSKVFNRELREERGERERPNNETDEES